MRWSPLWERIKGKALKRRVRSSQKGKMAPGWTEVVPLLWRSSQRGNSMFRNMGQSLSDLPAVGARQLAGR